jgi:hypothetical protein
MADHLYTRVPRLAEQEQGHLDAEAMEPGADLLATDAHYDPLSRRWMANPADAGDGSGPSDWTGTATVEMSLPAHGGTGVEVTAESWTITRTASLDLGRGFYLDFHPYEPDNVVSFTNPMIIKWGAGIAGRAAKWMVRLLPSEGGPGMAEVLEHDGSQYVLVVACVLLAGTFYNRTHRLWFQPLDDDEWLLSNRDEPDMGVLVRTRHPHTYDPDEGGSTDDGPPIAAVPWGPGPLTMSATGRAWVIYRDLTYPSTWTVQTKGRRSTGYPCTQDVSTAVSSWLPDGKSPYDVDTDLGSAYAVALAVFEGELVEGQADPDEWEASETGQSDYGWRLTVTGPADAGTGLAKRTACVDRLLLHWPRTLATDGATPVDLLAHETVKVLGLRESRSYRDDQSTLTLTLRGPVHELDYLTLPGQRWQWVVDRAAEGQPEDLYIRFDGIRDSAEVPRYTLADGTWIGETTVTIQTRWRQAAVVQYRGQLELDGALRSTAYAELAKLIPLDDTEVSISVEPTALADDAPLPKGRRGEGQLWKPEISNSLLSLIYGLKDVLGPNDRLLFRDVAGTPSLVIDQPTAATQATFYRTQAAADAAGKPAQCISGPDKTRALVLARNDALFFNEIIVAGEAPAPAIPDTGSAITDPASLKRRAPIVRYFAAPESWKVAEIGGAPNTLYVGARRCLEVTYPQLNSDAAVELRCRQLKDQYYRFQASGAFQAGFVDSIYPGDVVTVAAGTEPDAVDTDYRLEGMQTELINLNVTASRRYRTTYEIGEVLP